MGHGAAHSGARAKSRQMVSAICRGAFIVRAFGIPVNGIRLRVILDDLSKNFCVIDTFKRILKLPNWDKLAFLAAGAGRISTGL